MASRPRTRIFHELLNPNFGYFYAVNKTLYKGRTRFQKIEMIDTPEFGRVLLLDGNTQVVEKNDFMYHEPMVHPAMCCHPYPRDVLVIGGGDGGILREVLRYKSVRHVNFAELDEQVIEFSRKYLARVHRGSFDSRRVSIHVTDGRNFVQRQKGVYDVVIMDMTDPFGPSKYLYTREFFKSVKRSMRNPRAIFVMHSESPVSRPVAFNCIIRTLGSVFTCVQPIYLYIQMYSVHWSIALSSDSPAVGATRARTIDTRLRKNRIRDLRIVSGRTLDAMRVPFPYVVDILRKRGRIITDRRPDFPDHFVAAVRSEAASIEQGGT